MGKKKISGIWQDNIGSEESVQWNTMGHGLNSSKSLVLYKKNGVSQAGQ